MLYTSSPQTVTPTGNTTVSFNYWRSITGISIIAYQNYGAIPSSALYAVQGDMIQVSEVASSISSVVKLGYYVLSGNEHMTTTGDIYFWLTPFYDSGEYTAYNATHYMYIFPIYIGNRTKSKYLGTASTTSSSSHQVTNSFTSGCSLSDVQLGDVFYLQKSDGNGGTNSSGSKLTLPSGYYAFVNINLETFGSGSNAKGLTLIDTGCMTNLINGVNGTTYTTVTKTTGVHYEFTFIPYRGHTGYAMYLGTTKPTWCE